MVAEIQALIDLLIDSITYWLHPWALFVGRITKKTNRPIFTKFDGKLAHGLRK